MALTPSTMLPLGTKAPSFKLLNTITGQPFALADIASDKATVVMFICNHCPYVKHILHELVAMTKTYQAKGIRFVAISSNDADAYPADAPEKMRELAQEMNFDFPYLYDEAQDVATAYQAACTPDFYVFDKNLACVYRGRFDDSTPGNGQPVTGKDLSAALDQVLAGKAVDENQQPSMGCNIKWK